MKIIKYIDKFSASKRAKQVILGLLFIATLFAVLRDTITSKHDFSGYVIAGELAWNHLDIYSHHLNTWPPSFSVISILFYGINSVSSYLTQFCWLTGFMISYIFCFKWILEIFFNKSFKFSLNPGTEDEITFMSWVFIVPFFLGLRIIFEEIVNIQINIYLMTLCILALKLSLKEKNVLAGLLVAVTIACKVYTVILLPLLLFRKKWKFALSTTIWFIVIMATVFLYFGYDQAVLHHINWWQKDVVSKNIFDHGNQSIGSFITGLLCNVERFAGIKYNISSITLMQAKMVSLIVCSVLALITGIIFIKKYHSTNAYAWQFVITMTFIPIFSPISWKYYYVFVMPLTLILYVILNNKKRLKKIYWLPLLLITLSSEVVVGRHFSDVLEAYGVITISALILIGLSLYTYFYNIQNTDKKNSITTS
tara:strand:- start:39 stop:1307 length:1269 start_codon:yes stop_codon:yes gene_type:complete